MDRYSRNRYDDYGYSNDRYDDHYDRDRYSDRYDRDRDYDRSSRRDRHPRDYDDRATDYPVSRDRGGRGDDNYGYDDRGRGAGRFTSRDYDNDRRGYGRDRFDDSDRGYTSSDRYGDDKYYSRGNRSHYGDDNYRRDYDDDDYGSSNYGRGPRDYKRSDDRIREDVNDRLTDDHRVDASDIAVKTKGSEVTLDGHVNSRRDKRRAEDIVDNISGVTHVQNNLRVKDRSDRDRNRDGDRDGVRTYPNDSDATNEATTGRKAKTKT